MESYLGEAHWPRGKCSFVYYRQRNGRVGYFTVGRKVAEDEGYSPERIHGEAVSRCPF